LENNYSDFRHVGYLIGLIKKELDLRKNNDIKEFGITHTQFHVIMFITFNEDKKIFQKDIEQELDVTAATASGIIARLEANGFIRRTPLETDSRYKYLTLLPKSYEVKDIIMSKCSRNEGIMFNGFTPEEKNEAISYLERILKNVKEN